jgi:hypothetical protein
LNRTQRKKVLPVVWIKAAHTGSRWWLAGRKRRMSVGAFRLRSCRRSDRETESRHEVVAANLALDAFHNALAGAGSD